jgi:DNA-directed RNA polymerase alpha subunit
MNDFIISCLESRVEAGGNLYGKFFIGPFRLGQGTTIATALRRSLLSELSGLAIVAVEVRGAEHEYSALPGVRESVLDIILNLKQIALTGVLESERPCIGFLQFSGPGEAKASHIKFPAGIAPVHGNHHIATLSYDATLCLKLFIIEGKDSLIHNPSTIQNLEKLSFISSLSKADRAFPFHRRKIGEMFRKKLESDLPEEKENANEVLETLASKNSLQTELLANSLENTKKEKKKKLEVKPSKFSISSFKNKKFVTISQKQKSFYKNAILNILSKNSNEGLISKKNFSSVFSQKTNVLENIGLFGPSNGQLSFLNLEEKKGRKGILQKGKRSLSEKLSILLKRKMNTNFSSSSLFDFLLPRSSSFGGQQEETKVFDFSIPSETKKKAERWTVLRNTRCILPVDALFMPIHKANFSIETDTSSIEPNDNVIFELWTNGTLHPRQALFESAGTLIELFSNFRQIDPWFYMKKNLFFMFDQKQLNASHVSKFGNPLKSDQYSLEIDETKRNRNSKKGVRSNENENKEKNWMKEQTIMKDPILRLSPTGKQRETKISKSAIDSVFRTFSEEQEFSIDKKLPFDSRSSFGMYNQSKTSPFDIDLFTDQSVFSKRMILKENINQKFFQVSGKKTDFRTLQRDLGNLDIANLNLSLSVFVGLKNFGINNLQDLLKYSSPQYISLSILNSNDLKLLEKSLKEIGLKLVS